MNNEKQYTVLFFFNSPWNDKDEAYVIGQIGAKFNLMKSNRNWDFSITMPVGLERVEAEEEVQGFFGKKKHKTYNYYLKFPRLLTNYELEAWRMFLLGFFVSQKIR